MTFYLNEEQKAVIKSYYQNYAVNNTTGNYDYLFAYNNIQIEVYKDKVIFNGPKKEIIEEYRNHWKIFDINECPIIGNDEFGSNNFFGPIVVISCYIGSGNLEKLRALDIRDYKNLNTQQFTELAQGIMKIIIFESVIINNRKYNQWIDAGYSPTVIKTWGQNQALVRILQHKIQYEKIIIEQYVTKDVYYEEIESMSANKNKIIKDKVEFIKNAEAKFLAVTCSTIISRYLFLEEIKKIKIVNADNIPLGAGLEVKEFLTKIKAQKGLEFTKFIERHSKKIFSILENC